MELAASNIHMIVFSLFAIIPGVLWLLFFLREDAHPEPAGMIARVFLYGSLAAIPVTAIFILLDPFWIEFLPPALLGIAVIVLFTPLLEEITKYLSVRFSALKHPECDEPVDFMIYAVTAALGFATVENILFLLPTVPAFSLQEIIMGSFFRFIGGTLLHALASAVMGYFIALSVLRKRKILTLAGVIAAIILHSFYNFLIIHEQLNYLVAPLLVFSFLLVLSFFKKMRKKNVAVNRQL